MKNFKQFLFSCSEGVSYCGGDSLAAGYCPSGVSGTRVVGSDAETVLSNLKRDCEKNPEKCRDVVLSTGIINNPNNRNKDAVRDQIKYLKSIGAQNIRLIGLPNTRPYRGLNRFLASQGVGSLGSYSPGRDGIHPSQYDPNYLSSAGTSSSPSRSSNPPSSSGRAERVRQDSAPSYTPPFTSNRVLSKLRGVEGSGVGKDFVAGTWDSGQRSRYKAYGGK